jgi:hypothetical protein
MTDLQKRFAEEYCIDYHITNAGKRAGIKGDNVNITAWQMLQLPDVQVYVEQLQLEASKRCRITKDELISEFRKIGFSNIKDYFDGDLNARNLNVVTNPEAIKSLKKKTFETENGISTEIEFTLHDKVAGLVNLGRHIGFFSEDNSQRTQVIQLLNNDPLATTDDSVKEK